MPHIDRIHPHFSSTLRTQDGHIFNGVISQIQNKDVAATKEFLHSRRRLFVGLNTTFVKPGDLITNSEGRRFLVGDDGEGDYMGSIYRQFRLVEAEKLLEWRRRTGTTDAVTGLKREGVETSMGNIWCALEPTTSAQDQVRIAVDRYELISGVPLLKGDRVGGYMVLSVTERLGLHIAIVSDGG